MRRFLMCVFLICLLILPASAEPIKWVDFDVPYESMKYAMDADIQTFEQENHIDWIDVLAIAACRTGGKCGLDSVKKAAADLKKEGTAQGVLGDENKYFGYYREAYRAVLGGFLGSFAIQKDGQWVPQYGLKAFCPIAEGFYYSHYDDFGANRSFGFRRKHLGNDLLGSQGTPIVAVEGGVVEALGRTLCQGTGGGADCESGRRDRIHGQNWVFRSGECQQYRHQSPSFWHAADF